MSKVSDESPMAFFSSNVDAWGAAEWFDRLVKAIEKQDAAVVAGDDIAFTTYRNIASSSATRLARDFAQPIRAALEAVSSIHDAGGNQPESHSHRASLGEIAAGGNQPNPEGWMARPSQFDRYEFSRGATRPLVCQDAYPLYAHPAPISKGVTEGAHVSSLWQNKIDDMSRAYGILESQHREQRLRAEKLDDNLSLAIETLLNYADPSGYVDGDGNLPEHDEGALARSTLSKIAPYDARVKSCLSHTAGDIEAGGYGFQSRVAKAHDALFHDDPTDIAERRDRFGEESNELQQALGQTREAAHQLVDYTYDRPIGDVEKEIGAATLTLASLCVIGGWDMMACAEDDLSALQTPQKIAKVRAKRATRHGRSPLPGLGG